MDLNVSLKDILVMITFLFISSIIILFIVWYIYLHKVFILPIKKLIDQMLVISEHKDLKQKSTIDTPIEEILKLEDVFNKQNSKLSIAYDNLESSSNVDPLTQIFNRKKFNEIIQEELNIAQRYNSELTIILMDLNKFKPINDTYGHDIGDKVLISFSQIIQNNIRKTDKLFRIGGDEFILVLPHTSKQNGLQLIEHLKEELEQSPIAVENNIIKISASYGIAQYGIDTQNIEELMKVADTRMYEYKKNLHNY